MAKKKSTGSRKEDPSHHEPWILPIKKEHIVLILIFLLAVFIRLHADPGMPYHYDPGKNIVYAHAAIESFPLVPQTNPFFNLGEYFEYQVLFPYLVALIYKLTSLSLVTITSAVAILSGSAICVTVYFLSREIFRNDTAALVSAFLIAVSTLELLSYINYYPQILAMALMPLGYLFLIRYLRSNLFQDICIAAVISAFLVLASYLAAFVYFLILITALAVWCIRERKAITGFLLLPMTGILLTFFWLPIVWRHGLGEFLATVIGTITTTTPTGFTNESWTLASMLTFSSGVIIAVILGVLALATVRKIRWDDFSKVLLATWLIVSLALMASYLVRPVLWVDRFYQFFDIALMIGAGVIVAFVIDWINKNPKVNNRYAGYFVLLILIVPLAGAFSFPSTMGFVRWGYPSDLEMATYMQGLPADSLVVAPSSIQSFWFSAISGAHVLGGESPQMMEIGYQGNSDSDTIIDSPDVGTKLALINKYGVSYIVIPYHTSVPGIWNPGLDKDGILAFNDSTHFEVVKYISDDYGTTALIRVLDSGTPRYNPLVVNWGVTIAGYLFSIASLLVFVYFSRFSWVQKLSNAFLKGRENSEPRTGTK